VTHKQKTDSAITGTKYCDVTDTSDIMSLTLILLTWRIWRAPNNACRWQMGFNSAFKGLIYNIMTNNCSNKKNQNFYFCSNFSWSSDRFSPKIIDNLYRCTVHFVETFNQHIHKTVYIKAFKIAPSYFVPRIIFRELLAKFIFLKHSLNNSLY